MDKVLVFSENIKIENIKNLEIKYIYSKEDLARKLVSEDRIKCLIAEVPQINEESFLFFNSIKMNFPMLEAALITSESEKTIHGYNIINMNDLNYYNKIEEFINNSQNRNKRVSNRFSWPLTAWFSGNDVEWEELEIFSISSGGAYLKSNSVFPGGGSRAKVKINFANFSLESECEVVDSQSRSSYYPFGFSIKFTSISDKGRVVLNKLIDDAVIKILMEPESEPAVPSLGGEDLTPDFTFI